MGLISRVLAYIAVGLYGTPDIKHDTGGGIIKTGVYFQPANMDSAPLPEDYVLAVHFAGTGSMALVGFADPKMPAQAVPGEYRAYSRQAAGQEAAQLYLQADGGITLSNSSGFIKLLANGTVDINGVLITPAGEITAEGVTATTVTAGGKELAGHSHLAGEPPGTTGPNI